MRRWKIDITWSSKGRPVMDATSDHPIHDDMTVDDVAHMMTAALPVMSSAGKHCIRMNADRYDCRTTRLAIIDGDRETSIMVVQDKEMTEEEADAAADRITEWMYSIEARQLMAT